MQVELHTERLIKASIFTFLILAFLLPIFSHAEIIAEQTTTGDTQLAGSNTYWGDSGLIQTFSSTSPAWTTGFLSYVNVTAKISSGAPNLSIQLFDCGTRNPDTNTCHYQGSNYTTLYNLKNSSNGAQKTLLTSNYVTYSYVSTSTLITLNPNNYYLIAAFSDTGIGAINFAGNNIDTYTHGHCGTDLFANTSLVCSTVKDITFQIATQTTLPLVAQVYTPTSPTEFQVTNSTSVPVIFNYLNTSVYDKVGVELTDQSNVQLALNTAETNAQQNTSANYSTVLNLTANHAYRIRGYLRSSTSTSTPNIYSSYIDFSTITDQFFNASSSLVNISTITEANASSTAATGIFQFWNLQNLLSQKFPFNYFFEISNDLNALSIGTTSTAYTFDMTMTGNLATSSGNSFALIPPTIKFIDSDTMNTYYPPASQSFFRNLLLVTVLLAWALAMFSRLRGIFS